MRNFSDEKGSFYFKTTTFPSVKLLVLWRERRFGVEN